MKKTAFILFLFLLTSTLFGIDNIFGFSAGYNVGWFTGGDWDDIVDSYDSNDGKGGISLGIFYDIGITDFFSLQPEINFIVSGAKASSEDVYSATYGVYYDEELTETASIFTFPLLAKFKIKSGRGNITFFAGPMLTLLIGDLHEEYTLQVEGYSSDSSESDISIDNHLLFGYKLGSGYEFPLGVGFCIIDIEYSRTFNFYLDNYGSKANNFGINLGYGFRVK